MVILIVNVIVIKSKGYKETVRSETFSFTSFEMTVSRKTDQLIYFNEKPLIPVLFVCTS